MVYEIIKNLIGKGYKISFDNAFDGRMVLSLSKVKDGKLYKAESQATFEMMENAMPTEDEMIKILFDQTEKRFDRDFNSEPANH